jgi:hypothetical protein
LDVAIAVMRHMRWSWPDFAATPHDVVDRIIEQMVEQAGDGPEVELDAFDG